MNLVTCDCKTCTENNARAILIPATFPVKITRKVAHGLVFQANAPVVGRKVLAAIGGTFA